MPNLIPGLAGAEVSVNMNCEYYDSSFWTLRFGRRYHLNPNRHRLVRAGLFMAVFRRHDGDLRVEQDLKFVGVVTGTVTVCSASHFILDGTVMKDLIVQTDGAAVVRGAIMGDLVVQVDGSAIIHGDVKGTVLNEGGEVEIFNQ